MNEKEIIGKRFGKLIVIEDSGKRDRTSVLWRCKCDCGGEILAIRYQLTSGVITNCGCVPKKRASHGQAEDLTGQRFGELTVLRRVENGDNKRARWLCQCGCGNLHTVMAVKLKTGRTRSCGCRSQRAFYGKDLTGQQFGRLTALYLVKEKSNKLSRNRVVWHCRCVCGKEIDITADNLLAGRTQSCGCISDELRATLYEYQHYMEDTCIERLVRALNDKKENKVGFRGLSLKKDGRYHVNISFQKVRYDLGCYQSFEEAVQARLKAEEYLHVGFIKTYDRWKKQAEADSEWAERNPFVYKVQRVNGDFQIMTNAPDFECVEDLLPLSGGASG